MNDARLRAFTAAHLTFDKPNAAATAMACPAIIGQFDAVAQRRIEQQIAASAGEAFAIYRNLVASCHCLIP
jgi:hypothetical protein